MSSKAIPELVHRSATLGYSGCLQEAHQVGLNEDETEKKYMELIKKCLSLDQKNFLKQCLETLSKRAIYSIVSASSPTGRGKSAVLGLAIAGAMAMGYSNIYVTALGFDDVSVVFKFLLEGLAALNYEEDKDYDIIQYDHPMLNTAVLELRMFKDNAQAVRFAHPGEDESEWERAELVVIDEAAAIPLPLLKRFIGPYTILMASSTQGIGASGKFLYEDMVNKLRQSSTSESGTSLVSLFPTSETNTLVTIQLNEPLAAEDGVEKRINHALCLGSSAQNLSCGAPALEYCRLFYVCRETLFSNESHAKKFLQQLMFMFSCSKRKISPDDLLMTADEKDYHIFCLLPPLDKSGKPSFDILSAILVQKVKHLPLNLVYYGLDLEDSMPEYFSDWKSPSTDKEYFLSMQGIRIVDIVTHPTFRHTDFNYDYRALDLLQEFYSGKSVPLDDNPFLYSTVSKTLTEGTKENRPLLLQLTEVESDKMEYILVSFYLTPELLKFWKKSGFVPIFISTQKNFALEHLCIMMKSLDGGEILEYVKDNRKAFLSYFTKFLATRFKYFPTLLALELLISAFNKQLPKEVPSKRMIDIILTPLGMKSLDWYCRNLSDLNTIAPYIAMLSERYFRNYLCGVEISVIQQAVLSSFGLQHKTIKVIGKEIGLTATQVNAKLNQVVIIMYKYLNNIIEKEIEKSIPVRDVNMVPVTQSLEEELDEAAQKVKEKQAESLKKLKEMDLSEYAIKGTEDDWAKALHTGRKTLVSIKSLKKPPENTDIVKTEHHPKGKKSRKRKK